MKKEMTFVIDESCEEHNYLGWPKIDVLKFNVDNEGGALVLLHSDNKSCHTEVYSGEDLRFVIGGPCYKLLKMPEAAESTQEINRLINFMLSLPEYKRKELAGMLIASTLNEIPKSKLESLFS